MLKQIEEPVNTTAREPTSCWWFPPNCIIIIAKFLERAKNYEHFIKEDGLLEDPQELQNFEKNGDSLRGGQACAQNLCLQESHSNSITDVRGSQTPQSYKRCRFTPVQCTATHSRRLYRGCQPRTDSEGPHLADRI